MWMLNSDLVVGVYKVKQSRILKLNWIKEESLKKILEIKNSKSFTLANQCA